MQWPEKGRKGYVAAPPRRQPRGVLAAEISTGARGGIDSPPFPVRTLTRLTLRPSRSWQTSLWHQCLRRLEAELPEQHFNTWIRPLQAVEDDGTPASARAEPLVVDWVSQNCADRIGELVGRARAAAGAAQSMLEVGSRMTVAPGPVVARGSAPACAVETAAADRRPAQPRFHVRELRRRQEQPARARRGGAGRRRIPGAPTTRCSSTAASASARRT